jgi:hypothetical protein
MTQLPPIRLLTTRLRIALAMGLTALVLVQEIRGLHPHRAGSVWLLGPPLLHGWVLMAVNVLLYAYICWLAFWCVRGTGGRERFFMVVFIVGSPTKELLRTYFTAQGVLVCELCHRGL